MLGFAFHCDEKSYFLDLCQRYIYTVVLTRGKIGRSPPTVVSGKKQNISVDFRRVTQITLLLANQAYGLQAYGDLFNLWYFHWSGRLLLEIWKTYLEKGFGYST